MRYLSQCGKGMILAGLFVMHMLAAGPCAAGEVELTPGNIDAAITAGQAYLLSLQNTDKDDPNYGSWIEPGWQPDAKDIDSGTDETASAGSPVWSRYNVGNTALITCALLESGMSTNDERIKAALQWLVTSQKAADARRADYVKVLQRLLAMPGKIRASSDDYKRLQVLERAAFDCTYNVAFRSLAFAAVHPQPRSQDYRNEMKADVGRIVRSCNGGAHGYVCVDNQLLRKKLSRRRTRYDDVRRLPEMFVDHSNSQYAVLAAWTGSLEGAEIPRGYWERVEAYWRQAQNADGGWGYTSSPRKTSRMRSYPAMTAAGIATLYITHDALHAEEFVACGRNEMDPHLTKALAWFETNFADTLDPKANFGFTKSPAEELNYYYLYGVERIGLACGYRTFGGVDWYRAGAEYILGEQEQAGRYEGAWDGTWVDGWRPGATAYAMLFLIRGKEPVYFARLQHDGDWNNRPRALANLARYTGGSLCEQPGHWQVVRMDSDPGTWHDAPVLIVSGSRDTEFTDVQLEKLRTYIQQGGTVLSVAEGSGQAFTDAVLRSCEQLFPAWQLAETPMDDILYRAFGGDEPKEGQPLVRTVHNGVRPLWVHVDKDITKAWQLRSTSARSGQFWLPVNVLFMVDQQAMSRHRSLQDWPAATEVDGKAVRVASLLWDGNANPEPLALQRFSRRAARRDRLNVQIVEPLDAAELTRDAVDIAMLAGTGTLKLTEKQGQAIRAFVDGGGMLLANAAGGDEAFYTSARDVLGELFDVPEPVDADHLIYTVEGHEIERPLLTREARRHLGQTIPRLEVTDIDGRAAVLLSREDIVGGLLGLRTRTIEGYQPQTAYALMRNIVLARQGAKSSRTKPVAIVADRPARREKKSDAGTDKADGDVVRWEDAGEYIGKTVTIEGRIVATKNYRDRIIFLNFHRDYSKHLTAVIRRGDFGNFPDQPEEYYAGKRVRVTGKVTEYKDAPQVELTSAEQIEVVKE